MSDPAPGTPNPGQPQPPKPALPPLKLGQNIAPKPRPKIQAAVQADNIAVVTILESRILDESNINEIGRQLMELVTKQYMIKMVIDNARDSSQVHSYVQRIIDSDRFVEVLDAPAPPS